MPAWVRDARRILVVAPHPDDDVIGCGGILYGLARAGIQPHVMYVTDGRASHPGSLRFPPARLAAIREREARAALKELGVATHPVFLRLHDASLPTIERRRYEWLVVQMTATMRDRAIDTVLGPWPSDPHGDHASTARALQIAIERMPARPRLLHYVVWTQIRGDQNDRQQLAQYAAIDVVLDPEQVEAKRRAILRHRSQTSALIDDDPQGFRIDAPLLERWLAPVEYLYEA